MHYSNRFGEFRGGWSLFRYDYGTRKLVNLLMRDGIHWARAKKTNIRDWGTAHKRFPSLFPFFSWLLQSILRETILYFLSKALVPRWFLRRRLWPLLMLIISLLARETDALSFLLSILIFDEKSIMKKSLLLLWSAPIGPLLYYYLYMCMWAFLVVTLTVCIITVFSCRENP